MRQLRFTSFLAAAVLAFALAPSSASADEPVHDQGPGVSIEMPAAFDTLAAPGAGGFQLELATAVHRDVSALVVWDTATAEPAQPVQFPPGSLTRAVSQDPHLTLARSAHPSIRARTHLRE